MTRVPPTTVATARISAVKAGGHEPIQATASRLRRSVALGFVGLAMIGLQFALSARFTVVAAPFG